MFIDSHVHFLNYSEQDYPWIGDDMQVLQSNFEPSDLKPLLDSIQFDGAVAVQARQTLKETEWLLKLANSHDYIKGVVGWVDLCADKVDSQIESYMNEKKFKGVRHVIHDEPDDHFMLRNDFNRGLSLLKEYDLTYDILIFEKHLPQTIKLVEQHPDQLFVIDHIAKPKIKEQKMNNWYKQMKILSTYDHVYCKISGMVTEANWSNQTQDTFTPYLDIIFDLFPAERLMIGSDWPVCTVVQDYKDVMHIVMDYVKQLSKEDQKLVLGKTCANFYQLM